VKELIDKTINSLSASKLSPRQPLQRFPPAKCIELAIPSFSPQILERSKTSIITNRKDRLCAKNKIHQEYKSERQALSREIRQDSILIESIRRQNKNEQTGKLKTERQKNFAWLEQEQATFNQQVSCARNSLRGGGTSLARLKTNYQVRKKKKFF